MSKNVGIFSGSFNPIHNGHVALASYIASHSGLDEVWLVVSPLNPLKQNISKTLAPDSLRFEMVQLALLHYNELCVSDIEFSLPQPNYTVNTLDALKKQNPDTDFSLIIGADNLAIFDRWVGHDIIMGNFDVIVYPRPGTDIDSLLAKYPKVKVLSDAPQYDISSTEVRRRIKNGENVSCLIDPLVESFIKEHGLYAD